MRSFESVIQQTMSGVEERAVASTDQLATNIRQTAEEAMGRFDQATGQMRQVATDIRNELAVTRDEVRRGVLELPEETRESANAMRRAVAEQINALKDLSRIVQDSGRAFDTSGASTGKKSAARTAGANAPAPSGRAAAQVAETTAPSLRGSVDTPVAADRASAKPQSASQSSGWVSDLLKRASDEPAPRSPERTVESLNSLSVDIARAIDHETATKLWQQYRRGERDIFTRRLYTLNGQRTFDTIKGRYGSDAAFRASVDRYIDDFERLLADVSRNDRDGLMTQTYLTSDTGKVYTMLAHANGRLR